MDDYFFACSYPLAPGSIVDPGNWGRMIKKYRTDGFGNAWVLFREEVFEEVRKTSFQSKPSRYSSIFLCESEADLREFIQTTSRVFDLIYQVEIVDSAAEIHRGCLSLLNFLPQENISTFRDKAAAYWTGSPINKPEILVESSVRILRALVS